MPLGVLTSILSLYLILPTPPSKSVFFQPLFLYCSPPLSFLPLCFASPASCTPPLHNFLLLSYTCVPDYCSSLSSCSTPLPALPLTDPPSTLALILRLFLDIACSPPISLMTLCLSALTSQPLPGEGPSHAGGGPPYFRCPVVTSRLKCYFTINTTPIGFYCSIQYLF